MTEEMKMDFNTPEWILDFESKNKTLEATYKTTASIDIYKLIFNDLTKERPLFIGDIKKPVVAKDYDDILKYIEEYDTVFIYLQEFRKSYSKKHTSIDSIYGFIVDIDNVRSHNIQEIIDLINAAPLKPNVVVSSGNGLHLYYLFQDIFMFYSYTYSISFYSYMANIVSNRKSVFKVINDIYKEVCSWYEKEGASYVVDKLHLSQPLRMCGAKTKNSKYTTQGFVVSEYRITLEDLADLVGVELIDDEVLALMIDAESQRSADVILDGTDNAVNEEILAEDDILGIDDKYRAECVVIENAKDNFMAEFRNDPKGWWDKVSSKVLETHIRQQKENETYLVIPTEKPKRKAKSNYDIFNESVRRIRVGAKRGYRQRLLHILSSRGAMHHIPVEKVTKDVVELAEYFTSADPEYPITESDVNHALRGYKDRWKYTNTFVLKETGVDLEIENKELARRENNRVNKIAKIKKILTIAEFVFQENPNTSLRQLYRILNEDYSIPVSRGWVTEREEIRVMKTKCMLAQSVNREHTQMT